MKKKILGSLILLILLIAPWHRLMAQFDIGGTLTQKDYRWYTNLDDQTETDPWPPGGTDLAEDTPITINDNPPMPNDPIRLRINALASLGTVFAGSSYRLQYSAASNCSDGGNTWVDVGQIGFSGDWLGYDNATPSDGSTLTSLLLSTSNVAETYSEQNPATSPNNLSNGQYGEWDWSIVNNGAAQGTQYCFRMTKDGVPLSAYDDYPSLVTPRMEAKSQNWRWYSDEEHETPLNALEGENVAPIGIRQYDPIKLRVTAKNITSLYSSNDQVYTLQVDTDSGFSNPVDVPLLIDDCTATSTWCFAESADTPFASLSTRLLSDSDASGFHLLALSSPGLSGYTVSPNEATEMEFTIKPVAADPATVYYFRLFDVNANAPVEIALGYTPPSLQTRMPQLAFSFEAVDVDTAVGSYTTNVASTASGVDFGIVTPGQDYLAAHTLRVSEDALGYQISVYATGPLQNALGQTIQGVEGTNEYPAPWSFTQSPSVTGVFGYHSTDELLSNGSTRFASDDTWAAFTEAPAEIVYTEGVAQDDIHDILYRLNIGTTQAPYNYYTDIYYVVTGTF